MRFFVTLAAVIIALLAPFGISAHACFFQDPIVLADIKYAQVVVTGRISNYKIVDQHGIVSRHGRFDILVDAVLVGEAPKKLTVTWYNSWFELPDSLDAGPYLIALIDPLSEQATLHGFSDASFDDSEPGVLAVLQYGCSEPFMFPSDSDQALAAREILQQ